MLCLEPIPPYDSERIRALREQLKLSQTVLASVSNISPSTVRKWEIGETHPNGPSLKLLILSSEMRPWPPGILEQTAPKVGDWIH